MSAAADPTPAVGSTSVVVPLALEQKHPDLIKLILASESMNDGERQYWVDMLPAMNGEQIAQLQSILQNERDQLAAIDAKYNKQIEDIAEQRRPIKEIEDTLRSKADARSRKEAEAHEREEETAEDILKKIEEL